MSWFKAYLNISKATETIRMCSFCTEMNSLNQNMQLNVLLICRQSEPALNIMLYVVKCIQTVMQMHSLEEIVNKLHSQSLQIFELTRSKLLYDLQFPPPVSRLAH